MQMGINPGEQLIENVSLASPLRLLALMGHLDQITAEQQGHQPLDGPVEAHHLQMPLLVQRFAATQVQQLEQGLPKLTLGTVSRLERQGGQQAPAEPCRAEAMIGEFGRNLDKALGFQFDPPAMQRRGRQSLRLTG